MVFPHVWNAMALFSREWNLIWLPLNILFHSLLFFFFSNKGCAPSNSKKRSLSGPVPGPSNSKKQVLSGPGSVPFVDSHVSTKNRRISDLVDNNEGDAIIKAAIRIFQNRGQKNAAKVLEILEENPKDFSSLHGFISEVENKKDKSPMMTPKQGLFHMLGMYLQFTHLKHSKAKCSKPMAFTISC